VAIHLKLVACCLDIIHKPPLLNLQVTRSHKEENTLSKLMDIGADGTLTVRQIIEMEDAISQDQQVDTESTIDTEKAYREYDELALFLADLLNVQKISVPVQETRLTADGYLYTNDSTELSNAINILKTKGITAKRIIEDETLL
jgi:hypothetical protein